MSTERPPIGLRPEWAFQALSEQSRIEEIIGAVHRYAQANKPIPPDWAEELGRRWREFVGRPERNQAANLHAEG